MVCLHLEIVMKDEDARQNTSVSTSLMVACATETRNAVRNAAATRSATTTASEMYRLALLMEASEARSFWSMSKRPLTRAELDASQSGDAETANNVDAFHLLSVIYNTGKSPRDGTEFIFRNLACKYDSLGNNTGESVGTLAGILSDEPLSVEIIYSRVCDLDPAVFNIRDADWIKEKAQDIRKFLRETCSESVGFFKSGDHDAENLYDAWSCFCSRRGTATWTDALILTPSGMDFMKQNRNDGKSLGVYGKDTGILEDDGSSSDDEDPAKRQAKLREIERLRKADYRKRKAEEAEVTPSTSTRYSTPLANTSQGGSLHQQLLHDEEGIHQQHLVLKALHDVSNAIVSSSNVEHEKASITATIAEEDRRVTAANYLQSNQDASVRAEATEYLLSIMRQARK